MKAFRNQFSLHRGARRAGARRRQRGATLFEAALIMGFIVVPMVEVVSAVQDSQGSHLADSNDRIGNPTAIANASTSNNVVIIPSGTNGSGQTGIDTYAALSSSSNTQGAKKWTAELVIVATDNGGNTVSGGVFEGTWDIYMNGSIDRTEVVSCSIAVDGNCTFSLAQLDRHGSDQDDFAIFTITGLDSVDLTPAAGVVGTTLTVNQP